MKSVSVPLPPCWDDTTFADICTSDNAFLSRWNTIVGEHAEIVNCMEDVYIELKSEFVSGTIARVDNRDVLMFFANADWTDHRIDVSLDKHNLLREIYPEAGRLWNASVNVEGRQIHVLKVISADEGLRPILLGALGTVDNAGHVTTARGRPGSAARVQALLLDGTTVASTITFSDDGVSAAVGPWRCAGALVMLDDIGGKGMQEHLTAEWTPGAALPALLVSAASNGQPDCDEQLQTPNNTARLRLLIDVADPQPTVVHVRVDGKDMRVLDRYLDVTDRLNATADLTQPWKIEVVLDGLSRGAFHGVRVTGLPRRVTGDFAEVDMLGSPWFEAATDVPSEGPVLPGLSLASLLRFHAHRPDPAGAVFERDVSYGTVDGVPLKASLYSRIDRSERQPAVVFAHGGGWASGDRGFHGRHAHLLAERGYVVMNIEYRLHPDAHWPDGLEDCKCAVRWLRAHATSLGADPDRIGFAGGSAGGHLAAMVALTPGQFEGDGGQSHVSSAVQAAVLWYPPTDIERMREVTPSPLLEVVDDYFGTHAKEASPVHHVHEGAPPILTITGSADSLVRAEVVVRFHASLDRAGVPNRLDVFEGADHGFDLFGTDWQRAALRMAAFFDEYLISSQRVDARS